MMTRKDIHSAKARVTVSVGESVRIIRELQGLTQSELARRAKIPQSTISAIESDTINLGVERAKTLARVLQCHPAVLVFPRVGRDQTARCLTDTQYLQTSLNLLSESVKAAVLEYLREDIFDLKAFDSRVKEQTRPFEKVFKAVK
jgi:transcriptional regulator with XRE-family HTH domain